MEFRSVRGAVVRAQDPESQGCGFEPQLGHCPLLYKCPRVTIVSSKTDPSGNDVSIRRVLVTSWRLHSLV